MWLSAVIGGTLWITGIFMSTPLLGRASATICPLLILILILFRPSKNRLSFAISLFTSLGLLLALAHDTSRMATGLSALLFVCLVLIESGISKPLRFGISALVVLAEGLYWTQIPAAHERLFGHDASLTVGPVAINIEGRGSAADLLLSQPNLTHQLIFGHGAGGAGTALSNVAGFPMDKPHDEFLRVFFDFGLIGLMVFALTLVGLVAIGIRSWKAGAGIAATAIPLAVVTVGIGFALTDNPLSYSWFMIPAGTMIGIAVSQYQEHSRTLKI